jgi:hypothetical protein
VVIDELVAHYNGLRAHKHPLNTMCNVALRIFAFGVAAARSAGRRTQKRPHRNPIWHKFKKPWVGTE